MAGQKSGLYEAAVRVFIQQNLYYFMWRATYVLSRNHYYIVIQLVGVGINVVCAVPMSYVLCPLNSTLFTFSLHLSHSIIPKQFFYFFFISYTFFRSIVERLSIMQYSYSWCPVHSTIFRTECMLIVYVLYYIRVYKRVCVCVCVLYEFWGLHLSFYHFEFSIIHLFRYCWDNIVAVTVVANTLHKYLILLLPLMWTWIYVV